MLCEAAYVNVDGVYIALCAGEYGGTYCELGLLSKLTSDDHHPKLRSGHMQGPKAVAVD